MSRAINRLSWLLIWFAAITGGATLVLVAAAWFMAHIALPIPLTWLLIAGGAAYVLLQGEGRHEPATSGPIVRPEPEPEIDLEDLEALHRMWQRGDISEATYRQAVARATRRFTPSPPPPPPPRHRWW